MARPSEPVPLPIEGEPAQAEGSSLRRGYARGRARDDQIRAGLVPLAPGERPLPVLVATAVATLLAIANVVLFASGAEIDGTSPSAPAVAVFATVMLALAIGMLRGSYWMVLAFQALLAGTVIIAALSLMVASNALALLLCLGIAGSGGWLFWKLVRVLARMQAPAHQLDA